MRGLEVAASLGGAWHRGNAAITTATTTPSARIVDRVGADVPCAPTTTAAPSAGRAATTTSTATSLVAPSSTPAAAAAAASPAARGHRVASPRIGTAADSRP